jgi:hypothetical protein
MRDVLPDRLLDTPPYGWRDPNVLVAATDDAVVVRAGSVQG